LVVFSQFAVQVKDKGSAISNKVMNKGTLSVSFLGFGLFLFVAFFFFLFYRPCFGQVESATESVEMKEATKVGEKNLHFFFFFFFFFFFSLLVFPLFLFGFVLQHVEDTNRHLTSTKQKYDKYQKSLASSNTDHRVASDSLKGNFCLVVWLRFSHRVSVSSVSNQDSRVDVV
jgi:hypothetical protein